MQGPDCNAAGAISHAMQHAMAAGPMGMHNAALMDAQHAMMGDENDEAWAHDFVMNPHMHHHHHHHHYQHNPFHHHHHQHAHFDPAAAMDADWTQQFHGDQNHAAQATVDDAGLAAAMEAAFADGEMDEAYAAADAAGPMDDWLEQFREQREAAGNEDWANAYNNGEDVQVHTVEGEPLLSVEEKDAASDFHGLLREIQDGTVVIEEKGKISDPAELDSTAAAPEGEWEAEYGEDPAEAAMRRAWRESAGEETGDDFIHEMMARERALADNHALAHNGVTADAAAAETWDEEFQRDEYTDEYLGNDNDEDWLKEYEALTRKSQAMQHSTEYPFEPENPFLFHDDPFSEGQSLLAAGTLREAVLAFEAACQQDAKNVEAWQFLGTTQAENEKDTLAIIALNNAVSLCPGNLQALSALAVSHTNESNHGLAMQALRNWITVNEKYAGIASAIGDVEDFATEPEEAGFAAEYLFVDSQQHRHVTAMFEAALEMDPNDVELHKSLGVLHNLSNQYDKAAENFRNALRVAPEDEKLWNKLGATLANGNRPREAVEAYNRALDLSPGFVRAQYNLGIAYSNTGDHVNAARQFIRAIVMQQGGVNPPDGDGPPRSTREVWDVLRMTLNLMDKSELVDLTWRHDVRPFLAEFGLRDIVA